MKRTLKTAAGRIITKYPGFFNTWLIIVLVLGMINLLSWKSDLDQKTKIWKLDNTAKVGGFKTNILGDPKVVRDKTGTAIFFDGIDDGLVIPVNPIEGWKEFTIEILFKPSSDGPAAPRFLHLQDSIDNRGTIEARITPQGMWYLDTFLKNGKTNERRTLIDSLNLHPCDQWYWVSLVYDGAKMAHYLNAVREMEHPIKLEPMKKGQISLGVRLNKVNWFKGLIREVRFHPAALKEQELGKL